jgi:hypothetical protein
MQYVSLVLGMSYGTILVPTLIIMGYEPLYAVSAVVASQVIGNLVATAFHHNLKNADFRLGSTHSTSAIILGLAGVLGPIVAVAVALNIPTSALKIYIAAMTALMGIMIVISRRRENSYKTSIKKILALGLVAGFNKGLTGGGYGTLMTVGQLLFGVDPKSAVAITSFAMMIASGVAAASYALVGIVDISLLLPLILGNLVAAPLAAYTVRTISSGSLRKMIGLFMILLSIFLILRLLSSGFY